MLFLNGSNFWKVRRSYQIQMKRLLMAVVLLYARLSGFGQVPDSIYFNLYTDSLKKGTYNYINVEGVFPDKRILPLDTTQLVFTSSFGRFYRNSLWIPFETTVEKVDITVQLRSKPSAMIRRTIYIKKKED